jgi:hypothetical protein
LYSLISYPEDVTWTIGASADFFERDDENRDIADFDRNRFNPKFGVTWVPVPSTTLRAAALKTIKRTTVSDQTIEPTQVAGFNQFFDGESDGTRSWRYGIGLGQKFYTNLFGGLEFSWRDLDVPFLDITRAVDFCKDHIRILAGLHILFSPTRPPPVPVKGEEQNPLLSGWY